MENTPVLFGTRLLLVSNYRPGLGHAKGKDAYLYIDDLQTGEQVARFGQGHSFASAYMNGKELNVFALEFTDFGQIMNSTGINRLTTTDLKEWKTEKVILPEGKEHLFNSSVCKDEKGYVMAYETDKPVQFCFKFARSSDLSKWDKITDLVFTGINHEYSACPVIRYVKPYYYVIYVHEPYAGHDGWNSFLIRSKDLETWEYSPFNPILEAATGDQETWSTVRVAQYDGSEKAFFEGHFPKNSSFTKTSAKVK
jgi:hypothetical protein